MVQGLKITTACRPWTSSALLPSSSSISTALQLFLAFLDFPSWSSTSFLPCALPSTPQCSGFILWGFSLKRTTECCLLQPTPLLPILQTFLRVSLHAAMQIPDSALPYSTFFGLKPSDFNYDLSELIQDLNSIAKLQLESIQRICNKFSIHPR